LLSLAAASAIGLFGSPARAYRPFDGTDADVADAGDFELELGPVQWYAVGAVRRGVTAPATVLNLGLAPGWELVGDAQNLVAFDAPVRVSLVETDLLLKALLLRGSLQGVGPGPSAAVEFGALLPNVNAEDGFGGSCNLIVSQRWPELTVHLNNWVQLTRGTLNLDWFEGAILEASDRPVRPVAEVFVEHEWGADVTTWSGLLGGIWHAREDLDLDFGLREARLVTPGVTEGVTEIRAGLTWTIGVWSPAQPAGHGTQPSRPVAIR
jgi:hypothetical protein